MSASAAAEGTEPVRSRAQVRRLAKGRQLHYVGDDGLPRTSAKDEVVRTLGRWLDAGLAVDAEIRADGDVVLRRRP